MTRAGGFRVGVMGAGAIGCYVGGALAAAGHDVLLVGRERLQAEIRGAGLSITSLNGRVRVVPAEKVQFAVTAEALAQCDLVLCAVKAHQNVETARTMAGVLRGDAIVFSLQNGVGNAQVLRAHLGGRAVRGAVVGFNVVGQGDGSFVQTTMGGLLLEAGNSDAERWLYRGLRTAGIPTRAVPDIERHQWSKLLLNLNNAVSALSGASTRELLLSRTHRTTTAAVMLEALSVMKRAGIHPAPLQGVPTSVVPRALQLPTVLFSLAARRIHPEARASMWEDLQRGRPTEVDQLNGEIVRLAERMGINAPLNQRLCALVHDAERAGRGSPGMHSSALWDALTV